MVSFHICQDVYNKIMDCCSKSLDLANLFAALADTTRLRLLNLMVGRDVCVCYFVEILGQSQPNISRHLAYLRKAGIVSARREGKWMHYSICSPTDAARASILTSVLAALKSDPQMRADLKRLDRAQSAPEAPTIPLSAFLAASIAPPTSS